MNAMPKHVVSTTLRNPTWNNSTVISGDVRAEVTRLQQESSGPILVMGRRTLVHTLMEHDLTSRALPASVSRVTRDRSGRLVGKRFVQRTPTAPQVEVVALSTSIG